MMSRLGLEMLSSYVVTWREAMQQAKIALARGTSLATSALYVFACVWEWQNQ